ncbi:MAG: helix-turn-helix domain-containing protein, partial [Methylococcaceae bacterium]
MNRKTFNLNLPPKTAALSSLKMLFTLPPRGLQLNTLEADLIQQALTRIKGNRSKFARLLGISKRY